jgi:hypothetical protein
MPRDKNLPRPVKISIRVGPKLDFTGVPNTREGWDKIAAETQGAVEGLAGQYSR